MKITRLFLLLLLYTSILSAQEKGRFRGGIDLSIDNTLLQALSKQTIINSIGKSYALSLKYNLSDNKSIGLKYFNQTFILPTKEFTQFGKNPLPSEIDGKSLHIDFNYYLHKKDRFISHFFEFGAGVSNIPISYFSIYSEGHTSGYISNYATFPKYSLSESIGYGIEFNHVRLALEYLFLFRTVDYGYYFTTRNDGKITFTSSSGDEIILLNRISLKLGYYIGGGS